MTGPRADSFSEFMRAAEPRLRIALVAGFGRERGREATAEALAYAWEHWERVGAMKNPAGYVYRVGQSRAKRMRRRFPPLDPPQRASEMPLVEPALAAALAGLTRRQRTAVVLIHGFEWTHQEVADFLGTSLPTAKTHAQRGLARLRAHLKETVHG